MDSKGNLAIGAGVGTAVGIGAGALVGQKEASNRLKLIGITKGMNRDQFSSTRVRDLMKNDIDYKNFSIHQKINTKEYAKKAASITFDKAMETAKKIKHKWIALVGAAGLAIGTIVAGVVSKKSQNKQVETETQAK